MKTTYAYLYKNENELKEFIQAHYHEFSNNLLIQANLVNWPIEKIDRLRRLFSTLLPRAVMIGSNSSGCLFDGMNEQSRLFFTHFKDINITSSLFKLSDNDSINDFVKGLTFDRPKAAMVMANKWTGMLEECLGLFEHHLPEIAIAGGISGSGTIIFTETMIAEEGIAAVTFSGQNSAVHIAVKKRVVEPNVSGDAKDFSQETDSPIPTKPLNMQLGKKTATKLLPAKHYTTRKGRTAVYDDTNFVIGFVSQLQGLSKLHRANTGQFPCLQKIVKHPGKSARWHHEKDVFLYISKRAGAKMRECLEQSPEEASQYDQEERYHLIHSKEFCDSIIQNHPDIIFTTDLHGHFHMVNPAFTKLFGKETADLAGKSWLEFLNPKKGERLKKNVEIAKTGQAVQLELELLWGKKLKTFDLHVFPIFVDGECVEILFLGRNMTELRQMEKKLEQMAYYDEKTGLPNQKKLEQILNQWIKKAERGKQSFPILFIKLDRIKTINDAFGHHIGDKARIQLASRIQSLLPSGSFLGRFSTDTFTVLLGGETDSTTVMSISQRILQTIQEPLLFENQEFYIASSIGISVYPFDGQEYASLMKNADVALSRTDTVTNKNVVFYLNEMNKEMIERVELERSLRKGIENNEFFLAYQPIINPVTNEIVACEALLRWEHPEWGIVSPKKFIPIAEETGMIHTLGKWILKTACLQVKDWQRDGFEHISVSVNVSAHQLQNNRFIDNIKQALDESALAPRYLHLELTESVMIDRSLTTVEMLRELMEMGIHISIDDFGTGYSSLSYLKHFPIHTLKIDRSFIQNLNKQSPDLAIVHAILTMGHGLGLRIVAEGIETTEQLHMLTSLGCDFVQGYLIEKPLEARRFTHWLERKRKNSNI
ncbi:diguanylate cyclase (GGDEF)-like protein/PAS domain S-box-containing protein [Bacillus thermophilus]|uniref:Diguanylate cyclase (GGDEF)-like protein/PAS domain S-box-containing protein n=1 Tax=Siminovitchia thermophila TaxID=1245522 RepID=A0ABS2RDZ6_9BACI|nr:GGDEF domain-containing phosphodiesterase [Siminovitchia thermophila]MBM7717414.1 diguanylate cyclase (GGDEF)-like protein/PAS domain S-box-containing protein [Siminovitchia thermophila]